MVCRSSSKWFFWDRRNGAGGRNIETDKEEDKRGPGCHRNTQTAAMATEAALAFRMRKK